MRARNWLGLIVCLVASAGCNKDNGLYCEGHPDDPSCASPDTPMACTSNDQCSAPNPVCDVTGSKTCVQCIAPNEIGACVGMSPVCGDDHACRACSAHADCKASAACLPDGSCAAENEVAYVDPAGTDNTSCNKTTPCTKVDKALATGRAYVKFRGTTNEQVTINNRMVTLLADPSAKLTSTNSGVILRIDGSSVVTILDLEIADGLGVGGIGISMPAGNTATATLRNVKLTNNAGGGISASNGTLAVSRSTLSRNTGGGISIMNAAFAIVGNVFYQNGTQGSLAGALVVSAPSSGANRVEFNSFNKNASTDGIASAIQCTVAGAFTSRNNIMSDNGTLSNMNQTGGTCMHAYSIARPGTVPNGTGNSGSDPMFKDVATGDLHLMPGSPALGAADPSSMLTGPAELDIDGQKRTSPADLGADEVP